MANDAGVTIIKKKKAGGGDGHHGGAWKVAYADFVTAMMAFFLLMWLLNATSEDQRKGLAEYFDPKVPIARISGGGSGAFGGDSVLSEETLTQSGRGAEDENPTESEQARGATGVMEDEAAGEAEGEKTDPLERVAEVFEGMRGESDVADELLRHIRTRVTDEGLIIELFDTEERPLFGRGKAEPTPTMTALLTMIGEVAAMLENEVAVEGHTDSAPYRDAGYGNWELSSDRAHAARRTLVAAGLPETRINRVVGKADSDLATPDNPASPRNRRIAVTILRSDR
ncbi:flagellar motor protein MotB [Rhodovulum sp. DZ06]|uniref:flagellar motor protein MotB n=1 Tax=Rhodovulum sp. DZ06 TaxID=3425126 RepID=UPI003D343B0B